MAALQYRYHPRAPRERCDIPVVVTDEDGREILGRLGNISRGGFMAECEEKVRLGSLIQLTLPDEGPVTAQVRWAVGWRFGAMIVEG